VGIAFAFTLGEVWLRFRQARSAGALVALALWAVVLVPWIATHERVDRAYEQRGFYRALWVWAVTDLSVVLAMAPV
jgi:hypothetical protein